MSRRNPKPRLCCRRKGCSRPRRRDDTFCTRCWDAVPHWIKQALAAAGRARDSARQTELWIRASDAVKSALPAHTPTPRIDGKRAYARAAAILGERDEADETDRRFGSIDWSVL